MQGSTTAISTIPLSSQVKIKDVKPDESLPLNAFRLAIKPDDDSTYLLYTDDQVRTKLPSSYALADPLDACRRTRRYSSLDSRSQLVFPSRLHDSPTTLPTLYRPNAVPCTDLDCLQRTALAPGPPSTSNPILPNPRSPCWTRKIG
jgi:hypothetical protein